MIHFDKNEEVIYEVRKHWFVFFTQAFFLILGAVAPFFLYLTARLFFLSETFQITYDWFLVVIFFYSLWVLSLWIVFFLEWTNYYLDVWYITDKRIIDVEQKGMFNREISNLRFDRIQDVTVKVEGVLATFLRYGDIKVQTAAESSQDFFMHYAAKPDLVKKIIFNQHNLTSELQVKSKIDERKNV